VPVDEIHQWLRQIPFRPFRIYLLEATRVEVRHPETCIVKLAALDLYEAVGSAAGPDFVRTMTVALRHITRLEEVAAVKSSEAGAV
jgi:hypothetical protein